VANEKNGESRVKIALFLSGVVNIRCRQDRTDNQLGSRRVEQGGMRTLMTESPQMGGGDQ